MSSPRGISLHIGVNILDAQHYDGWEGVLESCENDADTMQLIASQQGFETHQLKSTGATRDAVIKVIRNAASQLSDGDFFLLSYSGHGGQVTDTDDDEEDGKDDTWCLYDGELLDDEFEVLFSEFRPGVRVLMLSDSCHSGTMLRSADMSLVTEAREAVENDFTISRLMPRNVAVRTNRKNRSMYEKIQAELPNPRPQVKASVKLLSGCQEQQESFGNAETGRFTAVLKDVWNDGAFKGNYKQFYDEIRKGVLARVTPKTPQTPDHMYIGPADADFDNEAPFKIK